MRRSYGEFNHADAIHLDRVRAQGFELVLALAGAPDGPYPVGCSYVRGDGRRGATAVAPEHRAHGLGSALVRETVTRHPYQFSEVRPANAAQCRVLEKNGFRAVTDPDAVRRLLGELWEQIVSPPGAGADASYVRFSHAASTARRYVMYERHGGR
ncbi:GNAT family N-acetyltransferase [Streptomyces avidinii]